MESLIQLYKAHFGTTPAKTEKITQSGSNRQYVRLFDSDGHSTIGVISDAIEENQCFIYLAQHFSTKGLNTPKVLCVNSSNSRYIQEDLGNQSLHNVLENARKENYQLAGKWKDVISTTIKLLPVMQVKGNTGLDYDQCIEPKIFDEQAAMFDLNYFKYCFLKTTNMPFNEIKLETDFHRFAQKLCEKDALGFYFLYRDFQSRNVMIAKDDKPYFIDFQGGMKGPLQYDLASFLWQSSAHYPTSLRNELIETYLTSLECTLQCSIDKNAFKKRLTLFVLFRILQVLGAYGLRGYVERKSYFLQSIPLAIQNLREILQTGIIQEFTTLNQTLTELTRLPQFSQSENNQSTMSHTQNNNIKEDHTSEKRLTVEIFSFSYKKGIPTDESGNGGGYVFDCRGVHNPGKYERYKQITGLDTPVIEFLEEDGEILEFLKAVYQLADAHVERYLQRGFTHLMFSFGCTGGQHRSVYSAQHLAMHLHRKYGIRIELEHREQGISTVFEKQKD